MRPPVVVEEAVEELERLVGSDLRAVIYVRSGCTAIKESSSLERETAGR